MTEYALAISDAEIRRYLLMAERAQANEASLWQKAGICPDAVVADIGCGPAAVSVRMAQAVGPAGRVVGMDADAAALAAARRVVEQAGVANVELRLGRATDTGLEPGSVDVAVLRHVLGHNGPDEQRIVDHLGGLLRPGGSVYLVDVDWTAARLLGGDPGLADLDEKYLRFNKSRGNDGQAGLRLGRLLSGAGLQVIAHEGHYTISAASPGVRGPVWAARESMLAEGILSPEDITRWDQAFQRMDAAEVRPTVFAAGFFAIGVKPR